MVKIELTCHANCDDVLLAWRPVGPQTHIPQCLGYAIEVQDEHGQVEVLDNLKGFEADAPEVGQRRPSTQWPFQAYVWVDHSVLVGTTVKFQVTAMLGSPSALTRGPSSGWSSPVNLSVRAGNHTSAFFNRGLMLSQFVARYAKQNQLDSAKALKLQLTNEVNGSLMQFLCGELGKAIRGILVQAQQDPSIELYCALFELDLDDLIQGLIALGDRAHVILANGSVKRAGQDENQLAAQALSGKVDLHRRMSAPHGLAHNKFVVICKDGKPFGVWTGSTNWTLTGLHTQINNGIALENQALAQDYLDQWHAIVAAGDSFPAALKQSNAQPKGPVSVDHEQDAMVWFAPSPATHANAAGGADIDELISIVNGAKQGILFVMFMPGQEPLDSILKRQIDGLYVRGVVSTLPDGSKSQPSATFQIMNGQGFKPYVLDVVEPQGVDAVGSFLSTFTRQQFFAGMGFAITHSKVIVVDPFSDEPVLITGSHNLSKSASLSNDENLLILRDCPELARAYAVNCMSVYKHYRWPAAQHDAKAVSASVQAAANGYLSVTDGWQSDLDGADTAADLAFWASSD